MWFKKSVNRKFLNQTSFDRYMDYTKEYLLEPKNPWKNEGFFFEPPEKMKVYNS